MAYLVTQSHRDIRYQKHKKKSTKQKKKKKIKKEADSDCQKVFNQRLQ